MLRNILTLAFFLTAIGGVACAQELGVELDGGLQGMHYQLKNGQTKLLPGGSLGMDYVFRLHGNIGLLSGVGVGLYRTQAKLQNALGFAYPEVDNQGTAFLYNVRFAGYEETQRTLAVTIPVLLQYHTDGPTQWYIDAGGKAFLPASTRTTASAQQMSLIGYYPNYDLEVSDLPKHGFGTVNGWKSKASTQLRPGVALSAGTGISFDLPAGVRLYVGGYVDYGLTALKTSRDSMPIVSYSPTGIGNVAANGLLHTSNAGQPKMLSYGLQVRLTWGAKSAKHKAQVDTREAVRVETQQSDRAETQQAAAATPNPPTAATPNPPATATSNPPAAAHAAAPVTAPAGAPISDSELIAIQRPVVFGIVGESHIPETQTPILDDVVTLMQRHPDLRISIVGYTCDGVQQAENSKLGGARAKAVARYLERKGIDRRRMDISYDKESSPSKTYDPAANYRNRRVLISPE